MDMTILSSCRKQIFALYNKTDSDINDYLTILREWMKKQEHLPSDLLQDEFLEIYLLKNKFSVEKTKSKIENYCSMKAMRQYEYLYEDYSKLDIPSKEPQCILPMPVLTDDYYRIIICKIFNQDAYDMKRDFGHVLIIREILSRFDYNNGEIIIMDYSECTPMIISKCRVNVLADTMAIALKGHSARMKEVHIIGKIASFAINITKTVLPEKFTSRIRAHVDVESVKRSLPTKCLPRDYGGELDSVQDLRVNLLDEFFTNHREKLTKFVNTKARENLRQASSQNEMQGTFKKLNID